MIHKAIKEHGFLERKDVDELLWEKLSDLLSEKQKKKKITNLLSELVRKKLIINIGTFKKSKWVKVSSKKMNKK